MILQKNEHIISENADENIIMDELDSAFDGYIILTDEKTGSYIQTMIASGGYTGIVEARLYDDNKKFKHYGAEISCGDTAEDNMKTVVGGISVMKKQVIELSSVKRIFLYFLKNAGIAPEYVWNEFPKDYFD